MQSKLHRIVFISKEMRQRNVKSISASAPASAPASIPFRAAPGLIILLSLISGGCDFQANAKSQAIDDPAPSLTGADSKPAQLISRIRVRSSPVEARSLAASTGATGVVQAFRKSVVAAEVGGSVIRRLVEPGTAVTAGQVLIELDSERSKIAFDRATAEAQARQVDYAQAEHELLRGRTLIQRNVISQDTLDDLRFNLDRAHSVAAAAMAQKDEAARILQDSKITAPFAGTAEFVHVQTGDFLTPGTPVVTIADFSKVRIVAGVTGAAASTVQAGTQAKITLGTGSTPAIQGTIKSIGRIADGNGTFPMELWVDGDAAQGLREGMVATVQLPQANDQEFLCVPRSALLRKDGEMYVYVLNAGNAELRPVALGRSDANHTQIINGVAIGEQVVIDGLFALRDGAPVELIE